MQFDFRFLLICESASVDGDAVSLNKIFDTVVLEDGSLPCDVSFTAAVGCVLVPEMEGKRLDLMAWSLNKKGARERLVGYAGTPLILPNGKGPKVCTYDLTLPVLTSGYHGFDLWDREGAFGPAIDETGKRPERGHLATYLFGVFEESARGPVHMM